MFWPNINKNLVKHVHLCVPCQPISNSQQKEPAIPIEAPCRSWKVLGMDIFVQGTKYYLSIADYHSNFPYIQKMSSISSEEVISAVSVWFSVLGTPEEIICDEGTQLTSKQYKEFADKWGFTTTTISPHYPRGHGLIERQVQIIKKLFKRCDEGCTNHQVALQELRATPFHNSTPSPAELFHGRQMETTLPAIIKPSWNSQAVRASLQSRQYFCRYDAQAKDRSTLLPT